MRTNCISMEEDFNLSLERFFAPNKEKLGNMVSKLKKMEKSLDAYLDKPLDENNVHYACGNALEEIMGQLEDLKNQMDCCRIELEAKAKAWEVYPIPVDCWEEEDRNEFARNAFITGYIDAKQTIK